MARMMRADPEFLTWVKEQHKKTGLTSSQVTRILARNLGKTPVRVEMDKKKRPGKKKSVLDMQIKELFDEFL